jgi:hypothetical protein
VLKTYLLAYLLPHLLHLNGFSPVSINSVSLSRYLSFSIILIAAAQLTGPLMTLEMFYFRESTITVSAQFLFPLRPYCTAHYVLSCNLMAYSRNAQQLPHDQQSFSGSNAQNSAIVWQMTMSRT